MSQPSNIHPLEQPEQVGTEITIPTRVRSSDYGTGTIVADFNAMGIQIYWDQPLTGTVATHLQVHDRRWVSLLEKLPPGGVER